MWALNNEREPALIAMVTIFLAPQPAMWREEAKDPAGKPPEKSCAGFQVLEAAGVLSPKLPPE